MKSLTALHAIVLLLPLASSFVLSASKHQNALRPSSSLNSLVPPSPVSEGISIEDFNSKVQVTYGRYPVTINRGQGCKLYDDVNGKEYLDFVAGIATCALGHNNAELTKAISDQMAKLHHVSNLYYIPEQGLLAKWIVDNSCADKVFFCNSGAGEMSQYWLGSRLRSSLRRMREGNCPHNRPLDVSRSPSSPLPLPPLSEANEGAIKLARKYASDRGVTDPVILTARSSFHGRTLAALSATAQPKYQEGFTYGGKMVQGFESIVYNDVNDLKRAMKKFNRTPLLHKLMGRKR